MHGIKVLAVVIIVAIVAAAGLFAFVPGSRPGIVKKWFRHARGFTPANTPEDALDKFKRALEARDFEVAALYCSGDYKEWIEKGKVDATDLGKAVDDLRAVMKTTGVKSDKAQFVLVLLDPFPPTFRYEVSKSGEDNAVAQLSWADEVKSHAGQSVTDWKVDNRIWNSMLPRVLTTDPLPVALQKGKDGSWTVQLPVQVGDRHMRDVAEYLRKNGSNFRNALNELKQDIKNSAPAKESFEAALKNKIEESK